MSEPDFRGWGPIDSDDDADGDSRFLRKKDMSQASFLAFVAFVALGCGSAPERAQVVSGAGVDTIISREILNRVAEDSTLCVSPDAMSGLWRQPAKIVQTIGGFVQRNGRTAIMDLDQVAVRVFDAEGRELARVGHAGKGPGEFARGSELGMWSGDTLVVIDPETARLSLFTERGYARAINLADDSRTVETGFVGVLKTGQVILRTRTSYGARDSVLGLLRKRFALYVFSEGAPLLLVADTLRGTELLLARAKDGGIAGTSPYFPRDTYVLTLGAEIAVHDQATNRIVFLDSGGRVTRVRVVPVDDQPLSRTERDSVMRLLRAANYLPPELTLLKAQLPLARTGFSVYGDANDGLWLRIPPPVSRSGVLHIRFGVDGMPDKCVRTALEHRIAARGRDVFVIRYEGGDADRLTAIRTVPFPADRPKD